MTKAAATYSRGRTYYVAGVGILFDHGTTVPSDNTSDYAPGCIFQKTDGSADACLYVNQGTLALCNFDPLDIGTLLASNIPVIDTVDWFSASNAETVIAEIGELLLANSGTTGGVGPSPLIWSKAPILDVMLDPTKGFYLWEDFTLPDVYVTTVLNGGILMTQQSSGGTLANDATVEGGILILGSGTSGNDDGPLVQWPGFQILPGVGTKIYFECRLNIDQDDGDIFIGLGAQGSPTSLLGTGTVVTNVDHCGFFRDDGVTNAKMGHQCSDGSNVDTADGTIDDVDMSEYEKFGFVITGNGATSGDNIQFYHEGASVKDMSDVADVPDGLMCPIIEIHTDDGTANNINLDWIRILVTHATGACRES